jgi:hypothetical protein
VQPIAPKDHKKPGLGTNSLSWFPVLTFYKLRTKLNSTTTGTAISSAKTDFSGIFQNVNKPFYSTRGLEILKKSVLRSLG